MKNKYLLIIIVLLIIIISETIYIFVIRDSFNKSSQEIKELVDTNCVNLNEEEKYYETLEEKLTEYGKLIYNNDFWKDKEIGNYASSLKDMQQINKFDISMFKSFKTEKECDINNTKIEFIIVECEETKVKSYIYNPVLDCKD